LNRRAQAFPGCGLDVHGFRALAERSLFADQIKDRAVASVSLASPPFSDGLTCLYQNEQVWICRID